MCLLDRIDAWDPEKIRASATSHRLPDNPLRAHGRLGVATGIEYAAQAMAAHGGLLAAEDAAPRAGYLTSVRTVQCLVNRLDDIQDDLSIEAERVAGDDNNVIYAFRVSAADRLLLSGRATVVLDASKLKGTM